MKFIERRYLLAYDLRACCIEHDWYTHGTVEEYENLFTMLYDEDGCHKEMTVDNLAKIAYDIRQHSKELDYSIEAMMSALNRHCNTIFEAV